MSSMTLQRRSHTHAKGRTPLHTGWVHLTMNQTMSNQIPYVRSACPYHPHRDLAFFRQLFDLPLYCSTALQCRRVLRRRPIGRGVSLHGSGHVRCSPFHVAGTERLGQRFGLGLPLVDDLLTRGKGMGNERR